MPSHTPTSKAPRSGVEIAEETVETEDTNDAETAAQIFEDDAASAEVAQYEPTPEELRAAWAAMQRARTGVTGGKSAQSAQSKPAASTASTKPADPYEPDELVTLLLPNVYRNVADGSLSKSNRVFVAAEQPGQIDDETGRRERSMAVTLTFIGGVCRDVPYLIVKGLKKSRMYRSNDVLKVVPSETPESAYAKLCGVKPPKPDKLAAMLLATDEKDLDALLGEFSLEQLKVFSAALARNVQRTTQQSAQNAAQGAQPVAATASDILSSASFQRG